MVGERAAICKQLKLSDLTKLASQVAFENEIQYLTDVLRLALKNREDKRIERLIVFSHDNCPGFAQGV
jgi:hypothetical protein